VSRLGGACDAPLTWCPISKESNPGARFPECGGGIEKMAESTGGREPRALWIEGPAGRLEAVARFAAQPPPAGAVLAHPHPLHGGTLHNPVVFHADRELSRAGWTTLRFNFRGVGSSEGGHDEGRGEVEDVGAAVSWQRGVVEPAPLVLVGYSFGSWCGIRHAVGDPNIVAVVAIGLPIKKYPFPELAQLRRPLGIVQAQDDEFGTPAEVEALLRDLGVTARMEVVPGTTHLFPGVARKAGAAVATVARWCLAQATAAPSGS
jgi:alpha/beta superfamily hydrolase